MLTLSVLIFPLTAITCWNVTSNYMAPATSSQIHYSVIILSFHAMNSALFTAFFK
jgi:hypothetical protein